MKKDKLYHIIVGFIIGFVLSFWRPGEALFAACLAGVGKELYDKYYKKSEADPLDAITTTFGGIFGVVLSLIIQ